MNRRQFLRTGAAGLGAAALGFPGQAGSSKPLRVGMIGSGWYGKCDLMRLRPHRNPWVHPTPSSV